MAAPTRDRSVQERIIAVLAGGYMRHWSQVQLEGAAAAIEREIVAPLVEALKEILVVANSGPAHWRIAEIVNKCITPDALLAAREREHAGEVGRLTERATRAEADIASIIAATKSVGVVWVENEDGGEMPTNPQVAALTADRDALRHTRDSAFEEIARLKSGWDAEIRGTNALAVALSHARTVLAAAQGEGERLRRVVEASLAFRPRSIQVNDHDSPDPSKCKACAAFIEWMRACDAALAPPAPGGTTEDGDLCCAADGWKGMRHAVGCKNYCAACDREGATAGGDVTPLEYHTHWQRAPGADAPTNDRT